jgi:hypothetical protein
MSEPLPNRGLKLAGFIADFRSAIAELIDH